MADPDYEVFDFPYHKFSVKYPETGNRISLGNSYAFTSEPTAPPQRAITLYFEQMQAYGKADEYAPDLTKDVLKNFNLLEDFYQRHQLFKSFYYWHVFYGKLVVKFNKPLEVPKFNMGGVSDGFSVELLEQP